jgi:hypothetical protein
VLAGPPPPCITYALTSGMTRFRLDVEDDAAVPFMTTFVVVLIVEVLSNGDSSAARGFSL